MNEDRMFLGEGEEGAFRKYLKENGLTHCLSG